MRSTTPLSSTTTSGGRLGLAAAAMLGALLMALPVVAGQSSDATSVREERGVYTVTARFLVRESAEVAWSVLTNYEQIPRFMPGVQRSVVRDQGAGTAVVEQEAMSSVLMFSKRVHLVLDINEQPHLLTFRDRCGRSFVRYEGSWRVVPQDGGSVITYELTAEPAFDVPGFVLKRLLKRDSVRMIDGLRREITARAALGPGPAPGSQK